MATQSISKQERDRLYYLKNRDAIRARSKARYEAKRDEINAKQKEKRDNNLEEFHAIERERYWKRVNVMRQRSKEYYHANKAKHNESVRRYREANRDKERAWKRRWLEKHPDRRRVSVRNNRDMRRREGNGRFTLELLLAKYAYHGWRCYLCGVSITFQTSHPDHRKPLSRGGTNWIANIAPACVDCNLHKNRRTETEYRNLIAIKTNAQLN